MTNPGEPRILFSARDLIIGQWHNVCLGAWLDRPTVASAVELKRQYLRLAKVYPAGFLSFGVIEAGVASPGDAERKAISAAMDAVESELVGAAVVLEGSGFAAAAVRAVLATMSMFTRSRFPRRFFSNVDEAAAWAASVVPELGGAAALSACFGSFRAETRRLTTDAPAR